MTLPTEEHYQHQVERVFWLMGRMEAEQTELDDLARRGVPA